MSNPLINQLLERLGADGVVTEEETLELRRSVFENGLVGRAEADGLFVLAGKVANDDPSWKRAFIEAIGDHVLIAGGHISHADANWLTSRLAEDQADALSAFLAVDVLRRAETAPPALVETAWTRLSAALARGPITELGAEWVRALLFAPAASGGLSVSAGEARHLFAIEAAADGKPNHAGWDDLFVKAILNHLMGLRASPILTREAELARRSWLLEPRDPARLGFLAAAFSGGLGGFFRALTGARDLEIKDEIDSYYDMRAVQLAEDEALTEAEVAKLLAAVRADDKTTVNEARLLEEVRLLQAESVRDVA
jgi:hypothetical protein